MSNLKLFLLCSGLCLFASLHSCAAADLSALERATVQHDSTLKTLDTISRRVIGDISGRSRIDGQPPVQTVFDMAYRPEAYASREMVKIKHLPLRQDLADAVGLKGDEKHQFLKKAKVSPIFLADPKIQRTFEQIAARDLVKAPAINELLGQQAAARAFLEAPLLPPLRLIPPAPGNGGDGKWHSLDELIASPEVMATYATVDADGMLVPVEEQPISKVAQAASDLRMAWLSEGGDIEAAADVLAASLIAVNPQAYPTELKRKGEVAYNRLGGLTLPGSFVYFVALVLFLLSAYGEAPQAAPLGRAGDAAGAGRPHGRYRRPLVARRAVRR